jgi:hypothetical protein
MVRGSGYTSVNLMQRKLRSFDMAEVVVAGATVPEAGGLSQVERVVDTFVAPSKTFRDILRSTSWWLPFVLYVIVAAFFAFSVDKKIGYDVVAEQAVQQSQMAQDRMANLAPDVRAKAIHQQAVGTRYASYAGGVFFLIFALIGALLNWATINFGFGAKTTFGQNFALQMYASLPIMLKSLLSAGMVFAGVGTESFNMQNPVGTNLGYYLADSAHWMRAAGTFIDLFGFWSMALSIIGLACISGKSKGQTAIVVVGWWLVLLLVVTGFTAAFG